MVTHQINSVVQESVAQVKSLSPKNSRWGREPTATECGEPIQGTYRIPWDHEQSAPAAFKFVHKWA